MENSQNFRITLHLTHFFQDYRSISKIFINSKMKYVADLESHVRQIFNLEKFYFMSNGHYIPSTEDIRILQQDDVVIAIPCKKTGNIRIDTTVSIEGLNVSQTKRKRRVDMEEEENEQNMELNADEGKNKKTKKKKKIKVDVYSNDNLENIEESNGVSDTSQPKQNSANINKKRKNTWSQDISDFVKDSRQTCDNGNKQNESAIKKNQGLYDSGNEELEEDTKEDSNSSVKEKITYFENHLYVSDLSNKSKKSSENQSVADDTIYDKTSQQNILKCLTSIEKKENNSDFSQKKLYIQKRNKDIISYDLPKKSNVVKSIVVSNKHSNIDNENVINNSSIKTIQAPLKDSIEQKYKTFMATLKNHIVDQSTTKINCLETTNTEIKDKSLLQLVFSQIKEKQTKIDDNTKNLSTGDDKMITCNGLTTCKTEVNIDNSNTNHAIPLSEKNHILEHNTTGDDEIITAKSLVNNFRELDHFKISGENDSANHSENISTSESMKDNISDSEKETSIQKKNESISDKQDEDIEYFETPSFVTKRKRKRSHRKRKSKTNAEKEFLPKTTENCYRRVPFTSTKPALHIKFNDDDDEICTVLENDTEAIDNCLGEKSFEKIQDVDDIENVFSTEEQLTKNITSENMPIHIEETPKHFTVTTLRPAVSDNVVENEKGYDNIQSSQNNLNKNHTTILSDSMEEMKNALACSTPLISQDTILKSPLMTSTKPKNRDIIAFKIFRLADDYSPEISKYIIGEVRSYDEENSNLELNIIDGLDQCKEPDSGKFSIEPVNEDCHNVKSFCWNNLIEPRLIFP